jgi:hypothetical protein
MDGRNIADLEKKPEDIPKYPKTIYKSQLLVIIVQAAVLYFV